MFDPTTDFDIMMRKGLRDLPVPEISHSFDATVLKTISEPIPWWRPFASQLMPLLSGAACSLVGTVLFLHWATMSPTRHSTNQPQGSGEVIALESVLEQPEIKAGSFTRLSRFATLSVSGPPKVEPIAAPKPNKRSIRERRSQIITPPTV